uniref:Small ribosomal subunit protein uS4c n=1 Tax=prasinophyte sp. MBIC10622 TaxID=156113 RepID=A0A650AKJ3_9CHLO|nr:ribosomal protein S4 [prasinophyte sp. MBIC10622]
MGNRVQTRLKVSQKHHAVLWPHKKLSHKQREFFAKPQRYTSKVSNFGQQLKAYQTLRMLYGSMTKSQLKTTYAQARASQGRPGDMLLSLLERRLDMVLYRASFATSVYEARQLVAHNHVLLNGVYTKNASTLLKSGDVLSCDSTVHTKILEKMVEKQTLHQDEQALKEWPQMNEHLEINYANGTCVLLYAPQYVDFPCQVRVDRVLQALES